MADVVELSHPLGRHHLAITKALMQRIEFLGVVVVERTTGNGLVAGQRTTTLHRDLSSRVLALLNGRGLSRHRLGFRDLLAVEDLLLRA